MDPIDELVVRLLGDSTGAVDAYDSVINAGKKAVDEVNDAVEVIEESLDGLPNNLGVTLPTDKLPIVDALNEAVDTAVDAAKAVDATNEVINRALDDQAESVTNLGDAYDDTAEQLERLREEVQDYTDELGEQARVLERIGELSGNIQILATALTALFGRIVYVSLQSEMAVQSNIRAFTRFTGSIEHAKDALTAISNLGQHPDLAMPSIERAARNLAQAGEVGAQLRNSLESLAAISVATGMEMSQLEQIYNRVRSIGFLTQQDLKSLSVSGVISLQDIAKHYGITEEAARRMMNEGKVGFNDLRLLLSQLTEEGNKAAGSLDDAADSLDGAVTKMREAWGDLYKDIGQALGGVATVLATAAADTIMTFREMPSIVRYAVAAIVGLGAAFAALVTTLAGYHRIIVPIITSLGRIPGVAAAAGFAVRALGAAFLGFGGVIGGVVVGGLLLFASRHRTVMNQAREDIERIRRSSQEMAGSLQNFYDEAMSSEGKSESEHLSGVEEAIADHELRKRMLKEQIALQQDFIRTEEKRKYSFQGNFGLYSGNDGAIATAQERLKALRDQLQQITTQTHGLEDVQDRLVNKRPLENHIRENEKYIEGLKESISQLRHRRTFTEGMSSMEQQDSILLDQMRRRHFSEQEIEATRLVQERRRRADMETRHKETIDALSTELRELGKTTEELRIINMLKEHGNAADVERVQQLQEELKERRKIVDAEREAKQLNEQMETESTRLQVMVDMYQKTNNLFEYQNQLQQNAIDLQVMRQRGVADEIVKVTEALMEQRVELNKTLELRDKAADLRESLKGPTEAVERQLQLVDELFNQGAITIEEATQASLKALNDVKNDPMNQMPGNTSIEVGSREDIASMQQSREEKMINLAQQQLAAQLTSNQLQTSINNQLTRNQLVVSAAR